MKTRMSLSLAANCVLVAVLLHRAWKPGTGSPNATAADRSPASAEPAGQVPSSPMLQNPGVEPFRWSRLESTNYRTYMANLRGIGCPEQTIRDIITADVHGLFDRQRAEFRLHPSSQPLEAGLLRLDGEEKSVIAALLGPELSNPAGAVASSEKASANYQTYEAGSRNTGYPEPTTLNAGAAEAGGLYAGQRGNDLLPPPGRPADPAELLRLNNQGQAIITSLPGSAPSTEPSKETGAVAPANTSLPLALKQFDPASVSLNAQEVAAIGAAQQAFQQQTAGVDSAPSDPAYGANLQRAKLEADSWLAAELGQPRFDEIQALVKYPSPSAPTQ